MNYHINKSVILSAGYDWLVTFPYGKQPISTYQNEHRPFEQLTLKNTVGILYFTHRYRLEQMVLKKSSLNGIRERVSSGYDFSNRARYRFDVTIPINRKTMEDKTLYLKTFDEVFLNFGEGVGKNILQQN